MKIEQSIRPRIDLEDDSQVDGAIKAAVREAMWDHKRRVQSVVVWQDGKIVHLPPEQIEVPDEDGDAANPGR